jgi:hypothetical protein
VIDVLVVNPYTLSTDINVDESTRYMKNSPPSPSSHVKLLNDNDKSISSPFEVIKNVSTVTLIFILAYLSTFQLIYVVHLFEFAVP